MYKFKKAGLILRNYLFLLGLTFGLYMTLWLNIMTMKYYTIL